MKGKLVLARELLCIWIYVISAIGVVLLSPARADSSSGGQSSTPSNPAADNYNAVANTITVESVLRAVQQRVYALNLRDQVYQQFYNEAAQASPSSSNSSSTTSTSSSTPQPSLWLTMPALVTKVNTNFPTTQTRLLIDWGNGLSSFPDDGTITQVSQVVAALNKATDWLQSILPYFYHAYDLKSTSIYTSDSYASYRPGFQPIALPSLPSVTKDNWRAMTILIGSAVNQFRALEWPYKANVGTTTDSYYGFSVEPATFQPKVCGSECGGATPPSIISPSSITPSSSGVQSWATHAVNKLPSVTMGFPLNWVVAGGQGTLTGIALKNAGYISSQGCPATSAFTTSGGSTVRYLAGIAFAAYPTSGYKPEGAPEFQATIGLYNFMAYPPKGMNEKLSQNFISQIPMNAGVASNVSFTGSGESVVEGSMEVVKNQSTDTAAEFPTMAAWLNIPSLSGLSSEYTRDGIENSGIINLSGDFDPASIEGLSLPYYPAVRTQWKAGALNDSYDPAANGGTGNGYPASPPTLGSSAELWTYALCAPQFSPVLTNKAKQFQVAAYSLGTVEVRCAQDPVRIHLGRGRTDCNQTAWLAPRFDGFALLNFVGSMADFKVVYISDASKYVDAPLPAPTSNGDGSGDGCGSSGDGSTCNTSAATNGTPGTFDFPKSADFTAQQKTQSGWPDYQTYLQAWHLPRIRQVLGGDILADVQYGPSSYSMRIELYWASQVGAAGDGGIYEVNGAPFKTIDVYNPTAPRNQAGLPGNNNDLVVEEDKNTYYEAKVTLTPNEQDPTENDIVWTVTKAPDNQGTPGDVFATDQASMTMPSGSLAGLDINWTLIHSETGLMTETELICRGSFNPSFTDKPIIESSSVSTNDSEERLVSIDWNGDIDSDPWGCFPSSITYGGDDSWDMSGTEIDFDTNGLLNSKIWVVEGINWSTSVSQQNRSLVETQMLEKEAFSTMTTLWDDELTEERQIGQDTTKVIYDSANLAQVIEVDYPNGFKDTTSVAFDSSSNQTTTTTISTYRNTVSYSVANKFGGLVQQGQTVLGVQTLLDTGSSFTPWGVPQKITHLDQSTESTNFSTSTQAPTDGSQTPYGVVTTSKDIFGNTTTFNDYDWQLRPSSWNHSVQGAFTPNYSHPLNPSVSCQGALTYSNSLQLSPNGEVWGGSTTRGEGASFNVAPGGGSLTVGQRQVGLDQDPTGAVTGQKGGLGSRGQVSGGWTVDGGRLCHTVISRNQSDSTDYSVATYLDAAGRVVQIDRPSSGSGAVTSETWSYNTSQRSVDHNPGTGGIDLPDTQTVNEDGTISTLTKLNNIYRKVTVQAANQGGLETIVEVLDDSSASGGLVQVADQIVYPGSGRVDFTPWNLPANKVSTTVSTQSMSIQGGVAQNSLTIPLTSGLPASMTGVSGGVPFSLDTIVFKADQLSSGSGQIGGKSVDFAMDGIGRLNKLSGPGFAKTFTLGGGQDYTLQISDSVQGTNQQVATSRVGDFVSNSGDGQYPMTARTTDPGNGQRQISYNSSMTATFDCEKQMLNKSYSAGNQMAENYRVQADGTMKSFGTGPNVAQIAYTVGQGGNVSATTTYGSGGVSVMEDYYLCGLRSSVAGVNDARSFTYFHGDLAKESHTAGPWTGSAVTRGVDTTRGLYNGTTVQLGGDGGQGAMGSTGTEFDGYARPQTINSALNRVQNATYTYNPTTGKLHSFARGPLTTIYQPDALGRMGTVSTSGGTTGPLTYTHGYNQQQLRNQRLANVGQSWKQMSYNGQNELSHVLLTSGKELKYGYTGEGNCNVIGSSLTLGINGYNEAYQILASPRGYGVNGTIAPGGQVVVYHPLAPKGEKLQVNATLGASTATYSGFWTLPSTFNSEAATQIEMLVQGTLPAQGGNGQPLISKEAIWVVVPPGKEILSYDTAGQLTGDGTWTYTWNTMGRLIGMSRIPQTSSDPTVKTEELTFGYDSDGRRTTKQQVLTYQSGSTKTNSSKMLWDGWLPACEERTLNGVVQPRRWFTWGRDVSGTIGGAGGIGGLVCIEEEGGRTLLPVDDGLGNITAVYDSGGSLVASFDYGPYGEPEGSSGDTSCCPFQYQSKYSDVETGLNYFGYRYYSPRICRWISRDPMGEAGGFNLYAYCQGDPVNNWDYLGDAADPGAKINDAQKNLADLTALLIALGEGMASDEAVDAANVKYQDSILSAEQELQQYAIEHPVTASFFYSGFAQQIYSLPTYPLRAVALSPGFIGGSRTNYGLGDETLDDVNTALAQAKTRASYIEHGADLAGLAIGGGGIVTATRKIAVEKGSQAALRYGLKQAAIVGGSALAYGGIRSYAVNHGASETQLAAMDTGMRLFALWSLTKPLRPLPKPPTNLASPQRTAHILYSDSTGGGHKFGLTRLFNGKSKFPITWSADRIMNAVSEVATASSSVRTNQTGLPGAFFTRAGNPAKFKIEGSFDGVKIRVIVEGSDLITAFPIK